MRKLVTGFAVLAFAFGCTALEVRAASCEGAAGYATVSVFVTKDSGGKPTLSRPADIVIYKDPGPDQNGRVCFVVRDLGWRQSLSIVAKPKEQQSGGSAWKDPFPGLAPVLTRGSDGNVAASPVPQETGSWRYSLALRKGGEVLASIDPVIIIEPGGGGGNIGK